MKLLTEIIKKANLSLCSKSSVMAGVMTSSRIVCCHACAFRNAKEVLSASVANAESCVTAANNTSDSV